ncbi:MAG TPA: sensor domain-containing diguanylate cyclase [Clostridia bacterium]
MSNPANKIEKLMEIIISLNNDFADQEAYIRDIRGKLSILNTLKEINYYMGSELDLNNVIQIVTDVVTGVLGVSSCCISLKKDGIWKINEYSVLGKQHNVINNEAINVIEKELSAKNDITVHDLSETPMIGLNCGSLIALPILRGGSRYGIVTIYYLQPGSLNESKIEFFKLISIQLGIHLENAYLFEKVRLSSITDGLTGLYNRLYLNEVLFKEDSVKMDGSAIIMMDIDNFKKVNDTYGHIMGDTVIKELAEILKEVQYSDGITCYRYGGEEFIVLLENTDIETLKEKAEYIRTSFNSREIRFGDEVHNFSISIGASIFGHSSIVCDINTLIDSADEALYYSKKTGKNKTTISTGSLQLFQRSLEVLNRDLARAKRHKEGFYIYKIQLNLNKVSRTEYNDIVMGIKKSFRVYDALFFSNMDTFMGILNEVVDTEALKSRLMNNIGSKYDAEVQVMHFEGVLTNVIDFYGLEEGTAKGLIAY